jgi:hypothetical protein
MLNSALLEINKEFAGSGILKHANGDNIGDMDFTISYKDDGEYVYILGLITQFKLKGSLTEDTGC